MGEGTSKYTSWKWETNPHKALRQYLSLVNPILGKTRLTPQEIEVLGSYLYVDYLHRDLPLDTRNAITFSKDTKDKIIRRLKTTKDAFNNVLSSLYRKNYISKNKKLIVRIPLSTDKEGNVSINISYSIRLNNERDEEFLKPIIKQTDDSFLES